MLCISMNFNQTEYISERRRLESNFSPIVILLTGISFNNKISIVSLDPRTRFLKNLSFLSAENTIKITKLKSLKMILFYRRIGIRIIR